MGTITGPKQVPRILQRLGAQAGIGPTPAPRRSQHITSTKNVIAAPALAMVLEPRVLHYMQHNTCAQINLRFIIFFWTIPFENGPLENNDL